MNQCTYKPDIKSDKNCYCNNWMSDNSLGSKRAKCLIAIAILENVKFKGVQKLYRILGAPILFCLKVITLQCNFLNNYFHQFYFLRFTSIQKMTNTGIFIHRFFLE